MDEKRKTSLLIAGAIALLAVAAFVIFRTVNTPKETISMEPVPAKGIDAGGGSGEKAGPSERR